MAIIHFIVFSAIALFSFSVWQLIVAHFVVTEQVYFFSIAFACALIYCLIRNRSTMWNTFWHELAHVFWLRVFWKPVAGILVTIFGGGTATPPSEGRFSKPFIYLAPYFFPIPVLILVIIKKFLNENYIVYAAAAMGFFLAIYYYDQIRSLRVGQPDIKVIHPLFSYLVILIMHSLFLSLIIISLLDQHAFMEYYSVAAYNIYENYIEPIVGGQEVLIGNK